MNADRYYPDLDYSWATVNVGLFFDAGYIRLGIDYSTNVGDANAEGKILGSSGSGDYDATYSFVNVSAILKYPVQMDESSVIWPAAGIEYSFNTTVEENGEDVSDTLDDFSDITPKPAKDATGDWSMYKFGVNIGIAYAL